MVNVHPLIYVKDVSNGTYKTYDASTGIGDLPGGKIALGQAFWVHTTGANPRLVVHEQAKTSQARFYRKTESIYPNLRITLKTDQKEVSSYIVINSKSDDKSSSSKYGFGLPGQEFSINLRSEEGQSMSHYAVSEVIDIPIEIRLPKSTAIALRFEPASGFNPDGLELYDKDENKAYPIKAGLTYPFNHGDSISLNRFFLRKRRVEFEDKKDGIQLYPNPTADGRFSISSGGEEVVSILVRDWNGNVIFKNQHIAETEQIVLNDVEPGVYTVEIQTPTKNRVKRLVVDP